jgi:site-specific recombinase
VNADAARDVLDSQTLLGPTLLFAAFTGVLLFASSLIAGWTENWFVFHRLDSAIAWNPRVEARLGTARAQRWAHWWRRHVSGLAGSVSLGFMLGLVPTVAGFFALPLEVRHITLSAGQLAAALGALGWDVLREPAFWWCVAAIPLIGALNVGVSFLLAFRVALRSRGVRVGDRSRIYAAIRLRLRERPMSFLRPPRFGSCAALGVLEPIGVGQRRFHRGPASRSRSGAAVQPTPAHPPSVRAERVEALSSASPVAAGGTRCGR